MNQQPQIIYQAETETEKIQPANGTGTQKRSYKANRLKTFEPATPEQLPDIPLKTPLIRRDLAICEILLFYRALYERMIERLLFWEPGVSYTKAPERLFKLYHHRFIDRIQVNGEMVYVLLTKGRDEIARQRGVDPKSLDWEPDHNRRSHHHWVHLLGNNEVRLLIYLGIEQLQSLYILNQAPLDPDIREAAKPLIEVGWSRSRVWEKINYLVYTRQTLQQPVADPGIWLKQAVEKNRRASRGFDAKKFVSPLTAVNHREEGFILRDWLTDLDLSRLKTAQKLRVEYAPPQGRQQRPGVVELDDEFEIVTPWLDKKGNRQSFKMMGEYDNLTRQLEAMTPPKQDKDDPTFANKMAKCVAMLNDGVYTKVRGQRLDKIFIVCNGGPRAVENRLRVIRTCGGQNAFFVVSLNVLKALKNPVNILVAPIWRKAGDAEEQYYPLIGLSGAERLEKILRKQQRSPAEITATLSDIQRVAKRQLYQTIASELDEAQLARVKQAKTQGQGHKLLRSFCTQHWGQTYTQALAVFESKVAQQRYEEGQWQKENF